MTSNYMEKCTFPISKEEQNKMKNQTEVCLCFFRVLVKCQRCFSLPKAYSSDSVEEGWRTSYR